VISCNVLTLHLSGETKENPEKSESVCAVSRFSFKFRNFRIQRRFANQQTTPLSNCAFSSKFISKKS